MKHRHPAFVWIAYGVLVLMNIVDLWYTENAFRYGFAEANPIMASIYQNFGMRGMISFKIFFLGTIFCVVSLLKKYPMPERVFYFVVAVYTILTFHHLYLLMYYERVRELSESFT
jgi:hypothetical protein